MIPEIAELAERMEYELHANHGKGDWRAPKSTPELFFELALHQAKLIGALKSRDKDKIAEHIADVCNLYLMVARAAGVFLPAPGKEFGYYGAEFGY